MAAEHVSVMLDEVINCLKPSAGDVILDGTFGAGGYTKRILETADCRVIATDRDETVKRFADNVKKEYNERFDFFNKKFSDIKTIVEKNSLDGIVLDLGVSSMQLDNPERGFSFSKEAPLKMTMGLNDLTAYDIVNDYEEFNIADIIYKYGEEVKSRSIAKKIVSYRKKKKIETTTELADIVRSCFPAKKTKIDYATKTFQALRIFVNDELKELDIILSDSIDLLRIGGRLVVVTFHSLEDRIVKQFFTKYGNIRHEKNNKYSEKDKASYLFNIVNKKPIVVTENEIFKNRRSRSAKLRWGIRC